MRKGWFLIALLFAFVLPVFATPYTVKSVTGDAKYKVNEEYQEIKKGDVLDDEDFVFLTGKSIRLEGPDGQRFFIYGPRKGLVKNIKTTEAKISKQTIKHADIVDSATGTRKGVATAASRASEAKEDFIWDSDDE